MTLIETVMVYSFTVAKFAGIREGHTTMFIPEFEFPESFTTQVKRFRNNTTILGSLEDTFLQLSLSRSVTK